MNEAEKQGIISELNKFYKELRSYKNRQSRRHNSKFVAFKNRIILLLEKGVEPHTNISEIVHERFNSRSMDKAFTKIAEELKTWNLVRALREEMERSVQNI